MRNILKISGAVFVILILFAGSWVSINWNHWQAEKAGEEAREAGDKGKKLQEWKTELEKAHEKGSTQYLDKLEEFRSKEPELYEEVMNRIDNQNSTNEEREKFQKIVDQRKLFNFGMSKEEAKVIINKNGRIV